MSSLKAQGAKVFIWDFLRKIVTLNIMFVSREIKLSFYSNQEE